MLKLKVVPRADVPEARTVPVGRSSVCIEFNPNRPQARVRFSLAHEVAHTLFPDCARTMRHRLTRLDATADEWQLEALCNIAAAEFLMPLGSLRSPTRTELSVNHLLELRAKYQVSSEAIFIRVARVSAEPCAVFCASRPEAVTEERRYRLDYTIGSPAWHQNLTSGSWLPTSSVVAGCGVVGYTAKGDESWGHQRPWHVECVAIPPYPRSRCPRVLGVLVPRRGTVSLKAAITEVTGNALDPRGLGERLIVHIANDATPNWGGGGFAQALRNRWPALQEDFKNWVANERASLSLGNVRITKIDESTTIASMICQKGYGPSPKPRIRYAALKRCLKTVSELAEKEKMSVHMPRIGAGQAGGSWEVVRELVASSLGAAGVQVTVYDLPNTKQTESVQQSLRLTTA
jgi:O-acetyl-ADP-ribose deacetylase (regulator of RNase III)